MRQSLSKAYLYGIIAVLSWATVASAFKIALGTLTPFQLLVVASSTAAVVLGVTITVLGKLHLLRQIDRREWFWILLTAIITPSIYLVQFRAYGLLPAHVVQPLVYTWPLFYAFLGAMMLGHKIKRYQIVCLVVSMCGVAIISASHGGFGGVSPQGVFYALLTSLLLAYYWLLNVKINSDSIVVLFICFALASAALNLYALADGYGDFTVHGIRAGVYVGLFEMAVPFIFWVMALKMSAGNDKISQLSFAIPVLSLLLIVLVLGESITPVACLGIATIIVGITAAKYLDKRAEL